MIHQRIRRFNTRDTYPEQKLDNDLCQVVKARGTMVFVRGQVGQDLATGASVAIGDAGAQADRAMLNIALLLAEAGASVHHICRITIYITDPRYREAAYRTIGKHLKGDAKASPSAGDKAVGQNRRVPKGCGQFARPRRQVGSPML
ncbi:MAG: RidA family protein [Proteobacteria bacterium]|nr:RidA family protein [Pseudomonadota bacterium]